MKYHLRRNDRQIEDAAVMEGILKSGKYATLALCCGDEPYVVTLSYGFDLPSRTLYFHCAKDGLKAEFVRRNPNACATIIEDRGYVQGKCAHEYRSVIIRGRVEVVEDDGEKMKGLDILIGHLEEHPETVKAGLARKQHRVDVMNIWKLKIEEITAKEGR